MPTDNRKEFDHESYGMIGFSRITSTGGSRLFGSSLENHYTTVRMRICQATRIHDLGRDWYHGGKELIEVELSAAQFAELLTTMNVGSGVPCTIRHVGGDRMDDPPNELHEVEEVREGFREDAERLGREMRAMVKKAEEMLKSKTPPNKSQREEILHDLQMFVQHVEKNMPFMASQFQEATEKMVTEAKTEVDAFITHNVVTEGLRSLAEKGVSSVPVLPPKKDE